MENESRCKLFLEHVDICGDLTVSIFILRAQCGALKYKALLLCANVEVMVVSLYCMAFATFGTGNENEFIHLTVGVSHWQPRSIHKI